MRAQRRAHGTLICLREGINIYSDGVLKPRSAEKPLKYVFGSLPAMETPHAHLIQRGYHAVANCVGPLKDYKAAEVVLEDAKAIADLDKLQGLEERLTELQGGREEERPASTGGKKKKARR